MSYDYPVTYRPDLVKFMAQNDFTGKDSKPAPSNKLDKAQVNAQRKAQARWNAYTTGNAYVLYIQNRTSDHSFRVISHGKNVFQAVRRYYRGFTQAKDNWIWQCTKVVAVYTMLDNGMSTSGDLLCGQPQQSYPY
jgi:hypothetical protein